MNWLKVFFMVVFLVLVTDVFAIFVNYHVDVWEFDYEIGNEVAVCTRVNKYGVVTALKYVSIYCYSDSFRFWFNRNGVPLYKNNCPMSELLEALK